jgi:hypothetical protein
MMPAAAGQQQQQQQQVHATSFEYLQTTTMLVN